MMNLDPPRTAREKIRKRSPSSQKQGARAGKQLKPDEYAKAVRGYSLIATGAGQNHLSLGEFLTNEPTSIDFSPESFRDDFVTLYPIGLDEDTPSSPPPPQQKASDSDADPESADERRHGARKTISFHDPHKFFRYNSSCTKPQSCIIFLRGYMSATWINNIGARYIIDPEFFCRHLDFRPADDNSNNFSIPALPSSSWHLIELPVITLGTRMAPKGLMHSDRIEELRRESAEALSSHHHRIAKLSSSGMATGKSMIREVYVFDETHFAIEQRVSIGMQAAENGSTFNLLVWLDAGSDLPPIPWAIHQPESYLLPIIRHKHMIALKCHLFASEAMEASLSQTQSASHLHVDYGRSLHPSIMNHDAFYNLTELFSFTASSHIEFLNLIDIKLDKYTSQPQAWEFQSLPHLKYTKGILYRHIQKTQRILESVKNARYPTWPKDETESGSRKAAISAQSLEQDFKHLLDRAVALHTRTTEAITVLMSSISISESQRAIDQAQRVEKLTFLAFIFVPLSFTTGLFGMNVTEIEGGKLSLTWWAVVSLPVMGMAIFLFYFDVGGLARRFWKGLKEWYTGNTNNKRVF